MTDHRIDPGIIELCRVTHGSKIFLARETYPDNEEGLKQAIYDIINIGRETTMPEYDLKIITQALLLAQTLKTMTSADRGSASLVAKAKEECGGHYDHTFFLGSLFYEKVNRVATHPISIGPETEKDLRLFARLRAFINR